MERREFALRYTRGYVLDVGCGDGLYVWGGKVPENVVCLDVEIYSTTHIRADGRLLPFRDKSFDTVLLLEVLEHVDDIEEMLAEAFRVARWAVLVTYPLESKEMFFRNVGGKSVAQLVSSKRGLGLKRSLLDEGLIELAEKVHTHWKDPVRITRDLAVLEARCQVKHLINYGNMYHGYGFVCTGRL